MVIVKIMGGLGNQMFQYAAGRRLALKRRTDLKLDLSNYRNSTDKRSKGLESFSRSFSLGNFNIKATVAMDSEIAQLRDAYYTATTVARLVRRVRKFQPRFLWPETHYQERAYRFDPAVLQLPDNRYLMGFWQSPKYFADAEADIRREFTMKDPASTEKAQNRLNELKKDGRPVISVHVRRGDLTHAIEKLNQPSLVHGAAVSLDYITSAMRRFDSSCQFLVFSDTADDIDWCRKNIHGPRVHYSGGNTDMEDFVLMSACDHHIIANSTFSWWASWLNHKPGKRVVAPRHWSFPGNKFQPVPDDLIPAEWVMI